MEALKRTFKRQGLIIIISLLILAAFGQMIYAANKGAGTKDDPLVTLSYLELKIQQLKEYIDQKSFSSDESEPSLPQGPREGPIYQVVELKKGESLIGEGGTELILRSGLASAITSQLGGLSDVTGARDIGQDEQVPSNHLLIIPREDGRGIKALADSFLLVRGGYLIN